MYNFCFSGSTAVAMYAETPQEFQTPESLKDTKEKLTNIVYFIVEWREVLAAFDCGM
jgi:hypothetical protein